MEEIYPLMLTAAIFTINKIRKQPKSVCVCVCVCVSVSLSVLSVSLRPYVSTRFLCPWDCPGKNTGVGCHLGMNK